MTCKVCGKSIPQGQHRRCYCSRQCYVIGNRRRQAERQRSYRNMPFHTPRKRLPCLCCGRVWWTDAGHRICPECTEQNKDVWLPVRMTVVVTHKEEWRDYV